MAADENRRHFLKKSAAIAGGVLSTNAFMPMSDAGATTPAQNGLGRVVGVEHNEAMRSLNRENPAVVERLTNEAIRKFTGKRTPVQAWRTLIHPSDIVGVKLNCLAMPRMSTSPAMVAAIVKGLQAIGLPNDRIILYEQYAGRLTSRGSAFALNDDPSKGPLVRHIGAKSDLKSGGLVGYDEAPSQHGSGSSHYSNLLKHCTAIINAPVIKDHNLAGVTVGMKNMTHGNINNPEHFHEHDCNPQIADIYAHPHIKDKVRVIVCDGLRVQYDGGPNNNDRAKVLHNRIYVATDPVAMDSWGLKLVEDLRKEHGKPALDLRHPTGTYLRRAESLGLGVFDPAKIQCDITQLS